MTGFSCKRKWNNFLTSTYNSDFYQTAKVDSLRFSSVLFFFFFWVWPYLQPWHSFSVQTLEMQSFISVQIQLKRFTNRHLNFLFCRAHIACWTGRGSLLWTFGSAGHLQPPVLLPVHPAGNAQAALHVRRAPGVPLSWLHGCLRTKTHLRLLAELQKQTGLETLRSLISFRLCSSIPKYIDLRKD